MLQYNTKLKTAINDHLLSQYDWSSELEQVLVITIHSEEDMTVCTKFH